MRSTLRDLRSFLRLPRAERVVFAQAWVGLVLAHLALRALPARWVLTRAWSAASRTSSPASAVDRVVALLDAASRRAPLPATCLTRALVLGWILRRRGIATTLRIGVARPEGQLTAHAWLETEPELLALLPANDGHLALRSGCEERRSRP